MTTVAKRYDVSSSFLARVCARLTVPRPPRGYWPQLKVGKAGFKPLLPAPEPGDELEWVRDGSSPARHPRVTVVGARKRGTPARSDGKHPLLVGVREDFEKGRVSQYDSEKYLRPYKRNIVDIFVSKETLPRALEVANKLFLALEDRGHRVVLAPVDAELRRRELNTREGKEERGRYDNSGQWRGPARLTLAYVDGVPYAVTVFEVSENVKVVHDHVLHDYVRLDGRKRAVRPGEWTTDRW
jgi:hypothetical protein